MTYEELQKTENIAEAKVDEIIDRLSLPLSYSSCGFDITINSATDDGDTIWLDVTVKYYDLSTYNPFGYKNPPVNYEKLNDVFEYDPVEAIKTALCQTLSTLLKE